MKKQILTYMLYLAGICFLLHLAVPHHHHIDVESIIEHQHIVDHAMGKHNEKEESRHHHHHEEHFLDELMVTGSTLQKYFVTWDMVQLSALAADPVTVPEPHYYSYCTSEGFYAIAEAIFRQQSFTALRAPPADLES